MYKLLLFLKKTEEQSVIDHFRDYTAKNLSELTGVETKIAKVESNLLSDQKYMLFCEAAAASKDDWDKLMNSKSGKELNKDLMDYHQFISLIFVEYK